jgi:hypothetical protein
MIIKHGGRMPSVSDPKSCALTVRTSDEEARMSKPKDDEAERMDEMMAKMAGNMSPEQTETMMASMMQKMAGGTGGCMPKEGEAHSGPSPAGGMMAKMLPRCVGMFARQAPAENRVEVVVDLLSALVESAADVVGPDDRPALLQALKARLDN